jgi:hypothetical protein
MHVHTGCDSSCRLHQGGHTCTSSRPHHPPRRTNEPFTMPDVDNTGDAVSIKNAEKESVKNKLPGAAENASPDASGYLQDPTEPRVGKGQLVGDGAYAQPALTNQGGEAGQSWAQGHTHLGSTSCSCTVGGTPINRGSNSGTSYVSQYVPGAGDCRHVPATSLSRILACATVRLTSWYHRTCIGRHKGRRQASEKKSGRESIQAYHMPPQQLERTCTAMMSSAPAGKHCEALGLDKYATPGR